MEGQSEEKSGAAAFEQYSSSLDFSDKDLAATIVPDHAQAYDQAIEQRVRRKVDQWLIPWMWLGYGFIYYDKVCVHKLQLYRGLLTSIGYPGKRGTFWDDQGSFLERA